ncbi:lipopolysaccharide biosynthesis protein [Clostridium perfringens]|uniref:lipopolysaccharide biosynthesis protein n=1 Tax=Clostridium perfringens TaxID=1502 RepID=UPI0024693960|nr:oligosaccharide flippase family protein [Clostridium perfringens]MDH5084133.1 putative membrane protein EpsK [Clostridium perfringens]MDK0904911.1 oligosaccharide flippase family protein [Clostridium perfringens]MDM0653553.1 oligosaccharide flippase family protein [Clostridium perfringens]MDM0966376.1 oligosaccharide flippase family protein [Clostridium perfringens]MDM0983859.1 oligosaccharide flippase family protein [Clostridium perfringens]
MKFKITENKQILINIFSSIIAFTISIVINFLLSPYIVKNLGEEANGFVQLANNFIMYASLITVALNSMAGRFISISYHKGDLKSANEYYSSLILGNIAIIIIILLPSIFLICKLENFLNISYKNIIDVKILFSFIFLTFFITQISGIFNISTYVTNELYLNNIVNVFRSILNGFLLIIFFSLFMPKIYFVSLVGFILSIVTLLASYLIKIKVLGKIKFNINNFNFKSILEMISSGIWNTINQCGNILMTGLDLLLANIFIDPIQMGLLSVAKIVPNSIIQLAGIVNSNFSPALTISYSKGMTSGLLKQLRASMKISSVLISIPIVVFCVLGEHFYELWMPTLNSKVLISLSILTCMTFIPFAGPQVLYNVYTTTNKLKVNSISVVVGGVFNFILVYLLIKYSNLGIYAIAGVSSMISIIRNLIITVPYTAILLNLRWYEFYKDVFISLICCLICYVITVATKSLVMPINWLRLIIDIIISSIISFIIIILFVLNKDEKKILKNKLLKGVRKNG